MKTEKNSRDILLILAVAVLVFVVLYSAWCWAAKIIWGIEPPEGTSLAVLGAGASQLLVGGGIQIFKKAGKSAKVKEVEAENKELRKQLNAANKQLEGIRKAAGQIRMDNA